MSRRRITLGAGGEFDLIRELLGASGELPGCVEVGPGDDAAVLEGGWVLSVDVSVEDVHFRRAWLDDGEVGYRAAAAALSDLAAMAAQPVGVLLSLALPTDPPGGDVDARALQAGVAEAAAEVDAGVLGGDVSGSPGPLVADVVALGRTAWPLLRDGARVGDEVWVTGALGGAAAAVAIWEREEEPAAPLRRAFARPRPRCREALCLAEREWSCALIDLSDGVAGDAGHLAAASDVRIVLEAGALPLHEAAVAALGTEGALDAALHGGEDYELCFTAPPGVVDRDGFRERFDLALTRVGRVEAGEGVWWADETGTRRLERGGFSHLEEGR